jgi:hypothetical protein
LKLNKTAVWGAIFRADIEAIGVLKVKRFIGRI